MPEQNEELTTYIGETNPNVPTPEQNELTPEERKLRALLWAAHACLGKYGDDGELQCNCFLPPIDFLRDTPEEIELKIPIHYAQLAKVQRTRPELREALAELEHEQWIEWAKNLIKRESLSLERIERWNKLMIPYSQLTEEQKDQDRIWADKCLALYPDIEQIDELRTKLTELENTLNDRETDLIQAKREEQERLMEWGDGICEEHKHFCERWHCPECRQALK